MRYVTIEFAPISERMWFKGERAKIEGDKIRIGGNWFNFNNKYIIKES